MMDGGDSQRNSLNVDSRADQLLDRAESPAPELFRYRISARGIFVDHGDEVNCILFAGKLMIDAGMVASECAYTYDSNGDGS
jgi:hypothetical protein